MHKNTKLDMYDYRIDALDNEIFDIVIAIDSPMDVTIADIASDINASDGYIYVEGRYYSYLSLNVGQKELHITARLMGGE